MDQVKIGRYIAEQRKKQKLTQEMLAEKLGITNRAVSKWERGIAMPDSSIMLELCQILDINVNELLTGESISSKDYNKELEKNLLEVVREKQQADKNLLFIEWIVGVLSVVFLLVPVFIAAYVPMKDWVRVVIILSALIPALICIFTALKIEQVAGYYECKKCGHRYVPTYKSVFFAEHMGRTRRMKCPNCGKKSWQKKVIEKK